MAEPWEAERLERAEPLRERELKGARPVVVQLLVRALQEQIPELFAGRVKPPQGLKAWREWAVRVRPVRGRWEERERGSLQVQQVLLLVRALLEVRQVLAQ